MNLRTIIGRNPAIIVVLVILAVLLATYVIGKQVVNPSTGLVQNAMYTTDDGKTWFRDSVKRIPPFRTSDGKEAVLVHVFSCKGREFPGFLEKYTPEYQAELQKVADAKAAGKTLDNVGRLQGMRGRGRLMKKPGDKEWTVYSDAIWMSIMCEDKTVPEQVR